jgi:hypothetical protein
MSISNQVTAENINQNELGYNIHFMNVFMHVFGAQSSAPCRTNTNQLWNGNTCAA